MLVKYILRLHSPANQQPEISTVLNEAGGVSQRCHMNLSCVKIKTTPWDFRMWCWSDDISTLLLIPRTHISVMFHIKFTRSQIIHLKHESLDMCEQALVLGILKIPRYLSLEIMSKMPRWCSRFCVHACFCGSQYPNIGLLAHFIHIEYISTVTLPPHYSPPGFRPCRCTDVKWIRLVLTCLDADFQMREFVCTLSGFWHIYPTACDKYPQCYLWGNEKGLTC